MTEKLTNADLKASLIRAERELLHHLSRAERLREWITATKKLCGKRDQTPAQPPSGVMLIPRRRTKTAVLATQVAEVLKAIGHPLHVDAIATELSKRGHPIMAKNPAATVAVALSRRPDQFTKVGPNTFDLAKEVKEAKAAG
jgi:hypothetical protein